jgi:hypothetical protein
MTAHDMLMTAVSLQREGRGQAEIEAALIEQARRQESGCRSRRSFAGAMDFVFDDGQLLSCSGGTWSLCQHEQVAPLYAATWQAFAPGVSQPADGEMRTRH